MNESAAALEQITWEHHALRASSAILFWFPRESLCPIALYELGAWSMTPLRLFVGADGHYGRRRDVEIQTKLARPDVATHARTLSELAAEVLEALSDSTLT